jgi:hypothetical protein
VVRSSLVLGDDRAGMSFVPCPSQARPLVPDYVQVSPSFKFPGCDGLRMSVELPLDRRLTFSDDDGMIYYRFVLC